MPSEHRYAILIMRMLHDGGLKASAQILYRQHYLVKSPVHAFVVVVDFLLQTRNFIINFLFKLVAGFIEIIRSG